jgi:hypothetical protein
VATMNLLCLYLTLMLNAVYCKWSVFDHHKHRINHRYPRYKEIDLADSSVHHRLRHHHEVDGDIPWPVKKEAVVEGDLVLGGLMMVHEREDTYTCGPVMPQGGIQALEAMLYTLDRLNFAAKPLLPNISLGAHILDDCDKDTYGLEMAVDFIKGKRWKKLKSKNDSNVFCNKIFVQALFQKSNLS